MPASDNAFIRAFAKTSTTGGAPSSAKRSRATAAAGPSQASLLTSDLPKTPPPKSQPTATEPARPSVAPPPKRPQSAGASKPILVVDGPHAPAVPPPHLASDGSNKESKQPASPDGTPRLPPPVDQTGNDKITKRDKESSATADSVRPAIVPLSTFLGDVSEDTSKRPLRGEPSIRPRVVVDGFTWPATCQRILCDAAGRFAQMGRKLINQLSGSGRVVALTSAARGEGRTTLLLCLAKALADDGARVLIADADGRCPRMASLLEVRPQAGWDDVLEGQLQLPEVLVQSKTDHLVLLPRRRRDEGPATASRHLQQTLVLGLLRSQYDLVLVDAPPVDVDEASSLASLVDVKAVDAALLVRDMRHQAAARFESARARLEEMGLPLAGIVENFASPTVSAVA